MKIKNIVSTVIVIFIFQITNAQQVWNLQQCIDYAIKNNLQIKQQELATSISEINLFQSKANLFPSLNANATHQYNYGKTVDRFTNQFATERVQSNNFYLGSEVVLFNGFQLLNQIKKSQYDLIASKYDLDKLKNDMSLNIATSYLQILYNHELLDIAKNQLEITKQQVQRTKVLVDAGTMAKGSLLTIESQAAAEELNVVNAQNQLDLSYLTMVQMLDLDSVTNFSIEKPELNLEGENSLLLRSEQIYNIAVTTMPEIKSAETKVLSSEKELSIARGTRSPQLRFSVSYGTGYSGAAQQVKSLQRSIDTIGLTTTQIPVLAPNLTPVYEKKPFNDQINDNINKSFGFNLSIPIFNNFQAHSNISRAKIGMKNSEYQLQQSKNQLNKAIQQAYADARAAMNRYIATQKTVSALEESFKYTQQKFDVGLVNSIDYNDSKNKLIKAKSDLLQSKYEYVFRTKVLDFYQGKPIVLN